MTPDKRDNEALLQAKNAQLAAAKEALFIALKSSELIHKLNNSLTLEHMAQLEELTGLRIAKPPIKSLELKCDAEGHRWTHPCFEVENSSNQKSAWWEVIVVAVDPPIICLLSMNLQEIYATGTFELLDEKVEMELEKFNGGGGGELDNQKSLNMKMSLAEFQELTKEGKPITVRAQIIIHRMG